MQKFSLFDELIEISKIRYSLNDEVLILDNETLLAFYDIFGINQEDMKFYPKLDKVMENHIIVGKKENEAKMLGGLVVDFDGKNKLIDGIEYDDYILRRKRMYEIKFYPFYGFILSAKDEEDLRFYADGIAAKIPQKMNEKLEAYVLPEWKNVGYLYHGTPLPLFLFERNLIPRTTIEVNGKLILIDFAFFSVIPTRTFACRKKSGSYLPSLYRYRLINPITNILDLDEITPSCNDRICNLGAKKGKECVIDSECPSIATTKRYSSVLQIYDASNQDNLARKIYLEGIFNGYKWTGHEFEVILVHPEDFIEFDSIQFHIDQITQKPCSDRTSPLTAPLRDLELIYVIYREYGIPPMLEIDPFLLSYIDYEEKYSLSHNTDITIYSPDSPENSSILNGYKKTNINASPKFLKGFFFGALTKGRKEFYNFQVFEKASDPDRIIRLISPKNISFKKANEDFKNGTEFFDKLFL